MRKFAILGLLISFVLVLFSPLASSFPDRLERVSKNLLNSFQDHFSI